MEWYYWLIIAIGILLILMLGRFFFNGPSASSSKNMKGKLVILTGSSSGIGKEAAFDLLRNGAEVIFACRDERKTLDIIAEIEGIETKSRAKFMRLDLADFESIAQFANNVCCTYLNKKIDILVNNAGLICKEFRKTKNNIEQTLQANLIGSMILSTLLIDKMENEGRIINVSSLIHKNAKLDFELLENDMNFDRLENTYASWPAYELSKLGQIYFTKNFADYCKLKKFNVKNMALHPGVVNTSFFEAFNSNACLCIIYYILLPVFWYFTKTPRMGAQTTLQLCYEDYNTLVDGGYYNNCSFTKSSEQSNDEEKRDRYMKYCGNLIDMNTREINRLRNLHYVNYLMNSDQSTPFIRGI